MPYNIQDSASRNSIILEEYLEFLNHKYSNKLPEGAKKEDEVKVEFEKENTKWNLLFTSL